MQIIRILLALISLMGLQAWADTLSIGTVRTVTGEAYVVTQGSAVRAANGVPVQMGSRLVTKTRSSLGVVLSDSTVVSVGSDAELVVDSYLFQSGAGGQKLLGNLIKGSMNYLSGAIAKLNPDGVVFHTPTGIIGLRGTHILALVDELRSYVTLIPDPSGMVGQVLVQGTKGNQTITQANFSAPLDGSSTPAAANQALLQQDFGDAIAARPMQPPIPTSAPAPATAEINSVGAAGAGAQASTAAAIGGFSLPAVALGIIAVGSVLQASPSASSSTSGTR